MIPIIKIGHDIHTGEIVSSYSNKGCQLLIAKLSDEERKAGNVFWDHEIEQELACLVFEDKESIELTINLLTHFLNKIESKTEFGTEFEEVLCGRCSM